MFHDYYHNEKILKMIEKRFGNETLNHVVEMVDQPLEREIFSYNKNVTPAGGLESNNIIVPEEKYQPLTV